MKRIIENIELLAWLHAVELRPALEQYINTHMGRMVDDVKNRTIVHTQVAVLRLMDGEVARVTIKHYAVFLFTVEVEVIEEDE